MVKTKQVAVLDDPEDEVSGVSTARVGTRVKSLFRPFLLAAVAILIVGVSFGPRMMRALPDFNHLEDFRVTTRDIEVTPPPHWVPHDVIEQVLEQGGLPAEMSLLDPRLTEKLATAFQFHPWVERVDRVTKSEPAQVRVDLVYRRPAAMVQIKQGLYPVDANGTLLPPADFSAALSRQYPLIVNVQTAPSGPAGKSWGDPAVAGAAQVAAALLTHWKDFGLDAIEIPPQTTPEVNPDQLVFHLYTLGGSRIIWGRSPDSKHPGELTAEQKIGRMEEYAARFGGFDQPNGPYEIDIRHLQLISRKPLAEASPRRPARR